MQPIEYLQIWRNGNQWHANGATSAMADFPATSRLGDVLSWAGADGWELVSLHGDWNSDDAQAVLKRFGS